MGQSKRIGITHGRHAEDDIGCAPAGIGPDAEAMYRRARQDEDPRHQFDGSHHRHRIPGDVDRAPRFPTRAKARKARNPSSVLVWVGARISRSGSCRCLLSSPSARHPLAAANLLSISCIFPAICDPQPQMLRRPVAHPWRSWFQIAGLASIGHSGVPRDPRRKS